MSVLTHSDKKDVPDLDLLGSFNSIPSIPERCDAEAPSPPGELALALDNIFILKAK